TGYRDAGSLSSTRRISCCRKGAEINVSGRCGRGSQEIRTAWAWRRGVPDGDEVGILSQARGRAKVFGVQWGRIRARHVQRPLFDDQNPTSVDRGNDCVQLCLGCQYLVYLRAWRDDASNSHFGKSDWRGEGCWTIGQKHLGLGI